MTDFTQHDAFPMTARVLGALFYLPPESPEAAPLVEALKGTEWLTQWPLPQEVLQPLSAKFNADAEETLSEAWQRLFVGPYALPSPPWGSV